MENVITHRRWLLKQFPFVWSSDITDPEERKAKDLENKKKRAEMVQHLVQDESSVGWQLKEIYDELNDKLTVKEKIDAEHVLHPYLNTHFSIIPAFFKLYSYLANEVKSKNGEFDFKIIFRTFGFDHKIIFDEFSEFLYGRHPLFENLNPEEKLFEHTHGNCGNILRSKENKLDIVLITGMHPNSKILKDIKQSIFDRC